jgi:hypothetical protein
MCSQTVRLFPCLPFPPEPPDHMHNRQHQIQPSADRGEVEHKRQSQRRQHENTCEQRELQEATPAAVRLTWRPPYLTHQRQQHTHAKETKYHGDRRRQEEVVVIRAVWADDVDGADFLTLEGTKEEAAGEGYVEESGVYEDGEAEALVVVVVLRVGS